LTSHVMRYVICYDIPDDKRRTKLADILDGVGDRVQYSIFEAVMPKRLLDNLIGMIQEMIDPDEDQVVLYPLCSVCAGKRLALGKDSDAPPPGEEDIFLV